MKEQQRITFGDVKLWVAIIIGAIGVFAYVASISARVNSSVEKIDELTAQLAIVSEMRNDITEIKTDVSWIKRAVIVEQ